MSTLDHKRIASSSAAATEQPPTKVARCIESEQKQNLETTPMHVTEHPPKAYSLVPIHPIHLTHYKGDIFDAPANALLIHACNTQGSWGAGIAAAFRSHYPRAYQIYHDYCVKLYSPKTNSVPTGTCLLIPPSESRPEQKHWIACLFTSARYGKAKDTPSMILENTDAAMRDLMSQVEDTDGIGEWRMCKINSARFAVPWEKTVEILEGIMIEDGEPHEVQVWSLD